MDKQTIMEKYRNKGITPRMKYERNDRTDTYRGIADVLIREAYGKEYVKGLCLSDLRKMITQKAETKASYDSQVIKMISEDIDYLESRINRYESGDKGEERARKALQMLFKEHCKLHSVFLSNQNGSAEYDDIVITPRGIFIIEVKNNCTDVTIKKNGFFYKKNGHNETSYLGNLGESMERKRYVLWGALPADIKEYIRTEDIHLVLLFVGRGNIENNLEWLDVCYSYNICHYIEDYINDGRRILIEDMERIYRHLDSVNKPYLCDLDIDIDKFAEDLSRALPLIGNEPKTVPVKVIRSHQLIVDITPSSNTVQRKKRSNRHIVSHKYTLMILKPFNLTSRTYRKSYRQIFRIPPLNLHSYQI